MLAALAALAVAGGAYAAVSAGAPAVPMPRLTPLISNPTGQTSAAFEFSDSQSHVSFLCSLDGSRLQSCGSPAFYGGPLREGAHTFQVLARNSSGELSAPATYAWTVITKTPPQPSITSAPARLTSSPNAEFSFTDSSRGVEFHCQLDGGAVLDCGSPRLYRRLQDGRHTFSVWASYDDGRFSPAASYGWTIDTTPPPRPQIVTHPAAKTAETNASFGFVDWERDASFECRLDKGSWASCKSPISYKSLQAGKHSFSVRAVDDAGNRSEAASFEWAIEAAEGESKRFSISGGVASDLYPGAAPTAIGLTLSNPNSVAIHVTSLLVAIAGSPAGCESATNIVLSQSSASSATPVEVPAHGSVTLPAQGVSAPTIQLRDLPVNQDACKGATFSLAYSGSAHS